MKNHVKISKPRSSYFTGKIKTNLKNLHTHQFLLHYSIFQYISYQPISVADLGSIINHVKPFYIIVTTNFAWGGLQPPPPPPGGWANAIHVRIILTHIVLTVTSQEDDERQYHLQWINYVLYNWKRGIFSGGKGGLHVGLKNTTFMCRLSWNLEASTSWNRRGLPIAVQDCFTFS